MSRAKTRALALDPGFASCGFAVLMDDTIATMGIVRTQKDSRKQTLATEDNFARARFIAREIRTLIDRFAINVLAFESYSAPRNASTAGKVALCYGVLADIAAERDLAVVMVTPQRIKKAVCGSKSASKEEIIEKLEAEYGRGPGVRALADYPKGQHNHAWDAVAAWHAAGDTDVVRILRKA
jgi:Holliday junction resolvasome RuvABC endonuclease subunit